MNKFFYKINKMTSVYCCYHNEVYLSCHNNMNEAKYNIERAVETKAKRNLLIIEGIPERLCECHNSIMFDQLLRGLDISDDAINAEIENVRAEFSIQEKQIV
jgi:hypothetical protein